MKKSILSLSLVFAFSVVSAQTKFPNKEIPQQQKKEMKKLLLSLALIICITAINAQTKFPETLVPEKTKLDVKKKIDVPVVGDAQAQEKQASSTIDFVSKVVDYGTIEHNADGARKFVFTNNGTEPLLIKNAKGSCGCTVPTWPREAIAPGATAEIGVKYATNRVGKFTKTITLTTNASKKPVILTVKGEVNPAPKEDTAPLRKTKGSPLEKQKTLL